MSKLTFFNFIKHSSSLCRVYKVEFCKAANKVIPFFSIVISQVAVIILRLPPHYLESEMILTNNEWQHLDDRYV